MKVLVLDGDARVSRGLERTLRVLGHEVRCPASASAARTTLEADPAVDIILAPTEKLEAPIEGLSTTKPNGTGLGLYTSECLIRASGGTLERGNRPAGGAQLRILLPRELR